MDHGWVVVARMPDARAAHEGGDVLGQTRPLLRTWRHGRSPPPIFRPPPPRHTGLGNLASARAIATAHRLLATVEPGCGNETNPSTMRLEKVARLFLL
ncbi:hypothetical protein C2845_PM16G16290 [Panicum miliaceum]|uniref:Uncharacterized protein n=1 Tax=Panicum miliaceum TaxID=4540 RepID=A0A3L6PYX8_PANMI|nr:hypothetical protein C2845_PM16G16290 [Panicum miliaceum]